MHCRMKRVAKVNIEKANFITLITKKPLVKSCLDKSRLIATFRKLVGAGEI